MLPGHPRSARILSTLSGEKPRRDRAHHPGRRNPSPGFRGDA